LTRGLSARARETVEWETPAFFAMSSRVIIWNVLGKVGCSLILDFEPKMDYTRLLQSCAKHCESDVSDFTYGEVVEFFVL
jgi:hypothetical protein